MWGKKLFIISGEQLFCTLYIISVTNAWRFFTWTVTELSFSKSSLNLIFYLCKLTLVTDGIIIWYCFGIEIRRRITLDLVFQFWWNFVSETFGMIAKNDLINFLDTFSCDVIIWSRSFLITWYKTSLNIKRHFSFVIVSHRSCY